ncbi:hypothetical protein KKH50_04505 [Patescibacteria group bacterium]|nr:hypothetical protein [Patescibacteria group bacterium]
MPDFYIPRTKQKMVLALREMGIKKPSRLRAMEYRQLMSIFCKLRKTEKAI